MGEEGRDIEDDGWRLQNLKKDRKRSTICSERTEGVEVGKSVSLQTLN